MRNNHITAILEATPISRLSREQVAEIEAHVGSCRMCYRQYEAARVAQALSQARGMETVDVSPFFATKVMASIREQQLSAELPAIVRMWKAAGSWVSAMAVLFVLMVGMTIFGSGNGSSAEAPETANLVSLYTLENVVFGSEEAADVMLADDQLLDVVYELEGENGN